MQFQIFFLIGDIICHVSIIRFASSTTWVKGRVYYLLTSRDLGFGIERVLCSCVFVFYGGKDASTLIKIRNASNR